MDIIVNEDLKRTAQQEIQSGILALLVPKNAQNKLVAKRNQERVKSILLLAIPDEYLFKFHNVPDAKSLWEAIKSRVYEDEMKRSSSSISNSQNLAFLSSENTSRTMQLYCSGMILESSTGKLRDLQQDDVAELKELDLRWQVAMLTVRVKKFIQKTGRNLDFKGKQPVSLDKSKVECYNCHRKGILLGNATQEGIKGKGIMVIMAGGMHQQMTFIQAMVAHIGSREAYDLEPRF
ncbi:hypothetical protein Tco_0884562 [Tanacetum coccineum]